MLDSLRVRLTLWYVVMLALLLSAAGGGAFVLVRHEVYEKTDLILKAICTFTLSLMKEELNQGQPLETAARKAVNSLELSFYSDFDLAIFDENGGLLARKGPVKADAFHRVKSASLPEGSFEVRTLQFPDERQPSRLVSVRLHLQPGDQIYTVVAYRGLGASFEEANTGRTILFAAVPLGLCFAGFGGWFLARKNLAPVLQMSRQAHRIGVENLDERLEVVNPRDELGQLATTFNSLLSRLNSAFAFQRQFMTDASHELRTPVSVIRTSTSVTLQTSHRSEDEYRSALTIIDEQVRRLARIVEDMFKLARADAGRLTLRWHPFYLDEILTEAVRAAAVLGIQKRCHFTCGETDGVFLLRRRGVGA
jgi:HAMP domain-containing protein